MRKNQENKTKSKNPIYSFGEQDETLYNIMIGRRFLGIEKESEYFKIAENRLEKAKLETSDVV